MKHRLVRVNELLRRELGEIIQREMTFSAKLVTIQQVDITPDLKHAHVFVSVIGTPAEQREALGKLHDKRVALQALASRRVVLKYTPQLHFRLDESVERGTRILTILEDLHLPPASETVAEGEEEKSDDDVAAAEIAARRPLRAAAEEDDAEDDADDDEDDDDEDEAAEDEDDEDDDEDEDHDDDDDSEKGGRKRR